MNPPETFGQTGPQSPYNPEPPQAPGSAQAAVQAAREKIESAGSSLLQWIKDNPATALASIFASGLAVGYALALGRRDEPTFRERFSDDPLDTIRETVHAALAPIGSRLQETLAAAQSAGGKLADRLQDGAATWPAKVRRMGDNLKFW